MRKLILALALCLVPVLSGCDDFERTTFKTLSASKAVIDGSQAAYEARTIPHNQCAYDLISHAKDAQTLAVNALLVYEVSKTDGAQQGVATALANLSQTIATIQTIGTGVCAANSYLHPTFIVPTAGGGL